MKRFLDCRISLLILLLLTSASLAYPKNEKNDSVIQDGRGKKTYLGVRGEYMLVLPAGLTINDHLLDNYCHYSLFNAGNGFSIGGIFHLHLIRKLYVEAGVNFALRGVKISEEALPNRIHHLIEAGGKLEQRSVLMTGLKMPVTFGLKFNKARSNEILVFMGPVFNYGFSMDSRIKIRSGNFVEKLNRSLYKPFDAKNGDKMSRFYPGWRLGLGFNISKFSIVFACDFNFGIYDVSKYNAQYYTADCDPGELSVSFGYNFR